MVDNVFSLGNAVTYRSFSIDVHCSNQKDLNRVPLLSGDGWRKQLCVKRTYESVRCCGSRAKFSLPQYQDQLLSAEFVRAQT